MDSATQHGYLVLADITGYTSYLAGVELDHAHEILTDLLETIVLRFRALLTISKLEGDAVFANAPESRVRRGETLLELIEDTYAAFRARVDAIHRRTTCECRACQAIPTLDLKFLVHHGNYVVQRVAGMHEMAGSDVNLIHRLAKNHVAEATGWRAYVLFTEAGLEHTGISFRELGAHEQIESYEHLGGVRTFSIDLHARYAALLEKRRAFVGPEEADVVFEASLPVPPPVVWQWLNDPHMIVRWSPDRHMVPAARPGGRTAVGARNHCVHGKQLTMIETVLDWRPFDYFTVENESKAFPANFYITYQLEPTRDGTRLVCCWKTKFRLPLPAALHPPLGRLLIGLFGIDREIDCLKRLIAEEQARAQDAAVSLPASAAA